MLPAILLFIPSVQARDLSPLEGKAPSPERAAARDAPALFFWGDIDGDGRLELAAVGADGTLQLLAETTEGRFEDVTEQVGLAGIRNAALALWVDYDQDGRLDLFVGAREGASRLFHNEGGVFIDMTAGSGLVSEGAVLSAEWLDHDGDGRPDLHVVTSVRHELFRGLEGGFFERTELPSLAGAAAVSAAGEPAVEGEIPSAALPGVAREEDRARGGGGSIDGSVAVERSSPRRPVVAGAPGAGTPSALPIFYSRWPRGH